MSESSVSFRDVAWRWLTANALWVVVFVIVGWIAFGLQALWDVENAEAGSSPRIAYAAVSAAFTVMESVIFGVLTAPVLGLIVPMLRTHRWIIANLVMGLFSGLLFLLWIYLPRETQPTIWSDVGLGLRGVAFVVVLLVLSGVLLGLLGGGLQAIALRPAAVGLRVWLLMSSASVGVAFLVLAPILFLSGQGPLNEAIIQGVSAVAMMVSAALMLPALKRLRPREA